MTTAQRINRSALFSPDGSQIIFGSDDGTINICDLTDLDRPLKTVRAHDHEIFALTYVADGSRLASCSRDSTIKLFDVQTLKQLAVLRGHEDYVRTLAVSPDGQRLVSGSGDGTVRIWETRPLSDRLDARRKSTVLRPKAEAIVHSLFEELNDANRVATAIEENRELTPELRRESQFAILRRVTSK